MKRLMSLLVIGGLFLSASPAIAGGGTVPYKNQKAGQFCKTVDTGKTVKLPTGVKLKCVKNGDRSRWK